MFDSNLPIIIAIALGGFAFLSMLGGERTRQVNASASKAASEPAKPLAAKLQAAARPVSPATKKSSH